MTGFGRGEAERDGHRFLAEIRSVNGKGLGITFRTPPGFLAAEAEIERLIRARLSRGSVQFHLSWRRADDAPPAVFRPGAAGACLDALEKFARGRGLAFEADLRTVSLLPGVFSPLDAASLDSGSCLPMILQAAQAAIADLIGMRRVEGEGLARELGTRVSELSSLVERIKAEAAGQVPFYAQKLKERVAALLAGSGVEAGGNEVAREAALLAQRSDVTEEIERLRIHLAQTRDLVEKKDGEPAGRRLEFLAQEIHREINTTAAKVAAPALLPILYDLRRSAEKFREQSLNVE